MTKTHKGFPLEDNGRKGFPLEDNGRAQGPAMKGFPLEDNGRKGFPLEDNGRSIPGGIMGTENANASGVIPGGVLGTDGIEEAQAAAAAFGVSHAMPHKGFPLEDNGRMAERQARAARAFYPPQAQRSANATGTRNAYDPDSFGGGPILGG